MTMRTHEERLQELLAWTPADNLVQLRDRLYFDGGATSPSPAGEKFIAQLLLVAVVERLFAEQALFAFAVKGLLVDVDDQAFTEALAGPRVAARVMLRLNSHQREVGRLQAAKMVFGYPFCHG